MISRLSFALWLALVLSGTASASVITEADAQFSRHWKNPTQIGVGTDTILGTAEKQNAHEFLFLTGLRPGAQTLQFAFDAPSWALTSDSYSAGGQVLFSSSPFRHQWDGDTGGVFQLSRWTPEQTFDLVLGDDFGGELYLGIYITHGRDVSWSVSADIASPEAGAVAAIPLPSAGPLAFGGMLILTALASRRGARQRVSL